MLRWIFCLLMLLVFVTGSGCDAQVTTQPTAPSAWWLNVPTTPPSEATIAADTIQLPEKWQKTEVIYEPQATKVGPSKWLWFVFQ